MTPDKLRYAAHLMADSTRSIPDICKELGGIRPSTLYHYVHADGSLKSSGRDLLEMMGGGKAAIGPIICNEVVPGST